MSDSKFGAWTVPESPLVIEYSLVVIEEIRHDVTDGFQKLSRGGIEVGGVLYGVRDGRTIRITAVRPISCEHARGPSFLLSDKDRVALNQQLGQDLQDPRLDRLISVGWFLSHTRSEIALSDADLEIYSVFFPAPWQVTLVIRPGRAGSMRAGFFVRETEGTVKSERSYLEFNFPDRLAGVLERPLDRTPRERGHAEFRARPEAGVVVPLPRREATPEPELPIPIPVSVPSFLSESKPPRRKWPWLVVWAVLVITAIVGGLRYYMPRLVGANDPISLGVVERDGELQIEWNHAAKPVENATRGSLQIVDGGDARTISLTPETLAAGKFTYARKSGDIEVRMTVMESDGSSVQEASRYLGTAPKATATADELSALQQRRAELEAEVARLRQQNDSQAANIQRLERTLRILQTRLGIDATKQ